MTDYVKKVDLLLAIAELPNEVSKKDILKMIYEMPIAYIPTTYTKGWVEKAGSDDAALYDTRPSARI